MTLAGGIDRQITARRLTLNMLRLKMTLNSGTLRHYMTEAVELFAWADTSLRQGK